MRISDVEKFESRIENMNLAIARLEQQMIEVWNPTPEWIQIIEIFWRSWLGSLSSKCLESYKRHLLI